MRTGFFIDCTPKSTETRAPAWLNQRPGKSINCKTEGQERTHGTCEGERSTKASRRDLRGEDRGGVAMGPFVLS